MPDCACACVRACMFTYAFVMSPSLFLLFASVYMLMLLTCAYLAFSSSYSSCFFQSGARSVKMKLGF